LYIVAGALGVFVHLEILRTPAEPESGNFVGKRPWQVLAFFALLGMTNLAKGLVFGTVIVLVTVGAFLLWNLRWQSIARYMWLWGWLAFLAVALPWPILVYLRYPDAIDVWYFDLFGRLHQHYLEQPAWYYFVCLLWVALPWSIAAFVGLGLNFRKVWSEPSPADRFVWCWAWTPLLVFSLSQGKHHHYMLHYLAPWAILAAQGVLWSWQQASASWQNRWAIPIGLAVAGDAGIGLAASKLSGPGWIVPALLIAWPLFVVGVCWFRLHRQGAVSMAGVFALMLITYVGFFAYKGAYLHRSLEDTAFLLDARACVPAGQPLMIHPADEALEAMRMQFYAGESAYLLHNLSFVRDDRVRDTDVYVVTRHRVMWELAKYGHVEPLLRCTQSRRETSEMDRWTLFRLQRRADLTLKSTNVRISPMQAMYRELGPDLDKEEALARRTASSER
jgi:4-amino-4-deoxy-L-arabinose transferase-like glycosyltransferase